MMNKNEDLISMFFGLGIVVLIVWVIFSFVSRFKGNISIPGVSTENKIEQISLTIPETLKSVNKNIYVVKKNDSLWKIAEEKYNNGNLWVKIAQDNNIKSPDKIEVDQELNLPNLSDAEIKEETKTETKDILYQVKLGDTLWKIAITNFGSGYKWVNVWNLNKSVIANPNRLEIGMMIKLR